jgi:branched-chain amino acid transport system substrate-binding protein
MFGVRQARQDVHRIRRGWYILTIVCMTVCFQSAVPGFAGSAKAATPFTISVVLPLTGGAAFLGIAAQKSLILEEKLLSADGGIGGHPVQFIFYDDQTSPQDAVEVMSQIVANNPPVILGSMVAGTCNAMAPLMRQGPVMYCFSPALYPKAGGFIFSSSNSTRDLLEMQIRYFRLTGRLKIGAIISTDASGQDAQRQIKAVMALPENKNMQLTKTVSFNPTDISAVAQIQSLKASSPQAILAWSTGASVGTVFKALSDVEINVPVATTDGNMTYAQMHQYASILPKTLLIPSPEWPANDMQVSPQVAVAKQAFFSVFKNNGITPDAAATFSWDPALLVVSALKKLGPTASADDVRSYLASLRDFAGIYGVYDFQKVPQRGLDDSNIVITQWSAPKNDWIVVSRPRGEPLND